jgi:hypothetical protein
MASYDQEWSHRVNPARNGFVRGRTAGVLYDPHRVDTSMSPRAVPSELAEAEALLDCLIAEHKPGHALQREFSTDPGIYLVELARIWRRGWLFAGHTCQVKEPGQYFRFDVDDDSVIVIRGDGGGASNAVTSSASVKPGLNQRIVSTAVVVNTTR